VAQSVEAGETLYIMADGPSRGLDYTAECDLKVTYPSGNTALVEWGCQLAGEWVAEPGCSVEWVEE